LIIGTGSAITTAVSDREQGAAAGQEENASQLVQSFVSQTAPERTELESFVATDASVVSVIQEIEAAAAREGVKVTIGAISVVPDTSWRFHESLNIAVSSTGSFAGVTAFATALESLPHASHVAKMDFEATAKEWYGTFTLDFLKEKTTP
jgi:hypothetical protein